jgi:hypothetical protein
MFPLASETSQHPLIFHKLLWAVCNHRMRRVAGGPDGLGNRFADLPQHKRQCSHALCKNELLRLLGRNLDGHGLNHGRVFLAVVGDLARRENLDVLQQDVGVGTAGLILGAAPDQNEIHPVSHPDKASDPARLIDPDGNRAHAWLSERCEGSRLVGAGYPRAENRFISFHRSQSRPRAVLQKIPF